MPKIITVVNNGQIIQLLYMEDILDGYCKRRFIEQRESNRIRQEHKGWINFLKDITVYGIWLIKKAV